MRLLIDGYNLMHAQGLSAPAHDPERLRKAREKLLKTISRRLSPVDRHATRVIFDAGQTVTSLPKMVWVDGITVEFAVDQPSADARICDLITRHDAPKRLVVVSSDNEIIQAANRRNCQVIGAEEFMEMLEDHRRPLFAAEPAGIKQVAGFTEKQMAGTVEGLIPRETDYWMDQFQSLISDESINEQLNADHTIIKSIDVSKIEKEIGDLDPFDIRHRKR
jgi:uncharacterized protein